MNRPLLVNSASTTVASVAEAKVEKAFSNRLHTKDLGIVSRHGIGSGTSAANQPETSAASTANGSDISNRNSVGLVSAEYLSSDGDSDV